MNVKCTNEPNGLTTVINNNICWRTKWTM